MSTLVRVEMTFREKSLVNYEVICFCSDSSVSMFVKDGKFVNPLKFIEKMSNEDCNKALLRIFPNINMNSIRELFENVPLKYNNLSVLSEQQRELYYKSLEYKYEKVFKAIYNILKEKNIDGK